MAFDHGFTSDRHTMIFGASGVGDSHSAPPAKSKTQGFGQARDGTLQSAVGYHLSINDTTIGFHSFNSCKCRPSSLHDKLYCVRLSKNGAADGSPPSSPQYLSPRRQVCLIRAQIFWQRQDIKLDRHHSQDHWQRHTKLQVQKLGSRA
jgi:hypothetical protein